MNGGKSMTEGRISRHLLTYAVPLILGNLFQLTYNAVDSVIIGKFAGEDAVAAVSSANPVMTIMILGVSGLCVGASVLMSEFFGAGRMDRLKAEFTTMLTAGFLFSVIAMALGVVLAEQILKIMQTPLEILEMSAVYLRIIFGGFLFTFLYNALSSALRSMGDSRNPVRYLMIAAVMNGLLDLLFVFGFRMGVVGAALATVLAESCSALLCLIYIRKQIPVLCVGKGEWIVDRELLGRTLKHGGITALQQCCQPIGKALIQGCINAQGITMIAAFNAVNRMDDFACIPEQSISNAMMTCVAQNRGAGKRNRVRETLRRGLLLEAGYGVCICAVTLLLKWPVMRLFAPEGSLEMIQMGCDYLTVMAFFYLLPGFTNGMQGFFRGVRKMTVTLIGTCIQISFRTLFVFLLVPGIGMTGAAWACMIGWTLMLLFEIPYYFHIRTRI